MASIPSDRPYGLWDSPITPLSLARRRRVSDVAWTADGRLVWCEGRSERSALVVADGQAGRDLEGEYSARGGVLYGGGDFSVGGSDAASVFFVEARSGRIYRQGLSEDQARPVTPAFGAAAAPRLSPDGRWLLYVHTDEDQDCLAIADPAGQRWPQKLAWGGDFYAQPTWHPDSQQVAWVSWDHPHMPWDASRLYLGRLGAGSGRLPAVEEIILAAGGEEVSVFQPEFSPDGRSLAYASDESGWWQLYLRDLESGANRQLTFEEAEHGAPIWVQGQRTYGFHPSGRRIVFIRNRGGYASLWALELESGAERQIPLDGYTWLEQPAISPYGERIALIASGSRRPTQLITCDLDGNVTVQRRTSAVELPVETYSNAEPVSWHGLDGETVYGLFYPAHNPAFRAAGLPPLVTLVHGGPTTQATAEFDAQVQFFTSRGYAVLQPNFRGSSGYGRAYRNALRGRWGVLDVQDCVSGALRMAEQGRADRERMAIFGSSSGGFTVYQALIEHPDVFRAGVSLYGVADHISLAQDTHKFEVHYSNSLLGSLPEAEEVYRQRSPRFHADRIKTPLALFHGEDDHVVPRAQSDEIAAALERNHIAHVYHVYPGEGHGFRQVETVEHVYGEVERFLKEHGV